ncbi:unnamed protein product, partial [Prorocentrum cordatum]
ATTPDAVIVRVSTEKKHTESWDNIFKRPGDSARAWAREVGSDGIQEKLRDAFKFHAQDDIIMGLWRMEVPALTELLARSGHRGPSGLRFFVGPARWQAPCPPPCGCDYSNKKMDTESWSQFADRLYQRCGPLGVARGDRSLGLRQPWLATDGRVRAWKLEHVPAGHSYTDVHNTARENGLKDVEFIADRHRPKGLNARQSTPTDHETVRYNIAKAMQGRGQQHWSPFWDGKAPEREKRPLPGGFSAYCMAMSKLGAWLGNLELAVSVAHYKIPLTLCQRGASAASSKASTPTICRLWRQQALAEQDKASTIGDVANIDDLDDFEGSSTPPPKAALAAEASGSKRPTTTTWTCPTASCKGFTIWGKYLYSKKNAHIAFYHEKQAKDLRIVMPTLVGAFPGKELTWTCPLCPMGLVATPTTQTAREAPFTHRLQHHSKAHVKQFYLKKGSTVHQAQAMQAQARRSRGLLKAKITGHKLEYFRMPYGPRRDRTHVRCRRRWRQAGSVNRPGVCQAIARPAGKLEVTIRQAPKALTEEGDPAHKQEIQDYLDFCHQ